MESITGVELQFTPKNLRNMPGIDRGDKFWIKGSAKLRDFKTDNNLLLLKTEMNAGHGGKSGRDGAIEEIAFDYAFALKISNKI